jgi:hypothetical protein
MMAAGMRLPTFLIVGSPKSGTTALSQFLSAHPDVFLSQPKEPHYFDSSYGKGLEAYLRDHYADWREERAAGEATPSYLAIPYVPERIRRDLPDAGLIAILRHPVDRAYSSWWMFHIRGMESLTFEDAVRENEERLRRGFFLDDDAGARAWSEHVHALRQGSHIRIRTYLDAGYYAQHLRRYFEYFPREQVRIVLAEQLKQDRDRVVRDLWRFIGVADMADLPGSGPVNEAVGPGARSILRLARRTGIMRLRGVLPESVKSSIKAGLSTMGRQPPLAAETRVRLLEHFEPHTRELEQLLGVELAAWRR